MTKYKKRWGILYTTICITQPTWRESATSLKKTSLIGRAAFLQIFERETWKDAAHKGLINYVLFDTPKSCTAVFRVPSSILRKGPIDSHAATYLGCSCCRLRMATGYDDADPLVFMEGFSCLQYTFNIQNYTSTQTKQITFLFVFWNSCLQSSKPSQPNLLCMS